MSSANSLEKKTTKQNFLKIYSIVEDKLKKDEQGLNISAEQLKNQYHRLNDQ